MFKLNLILIIMFLFCWSEKIEIVSDCNVRDTSDRHTSEVKGQAIKGSVYEVMDTYADWINIKVVKGKDKKSTSDHVGKEGWMWARRINVEKEIVIIEGCTLRSSPEMNNNRTPEDSADDDNFIAKVKRQAKISIQNIKIVWYKIKGTSKDNFKFGWVSASLVQRIN